MRAVVDTNVLISAFLWGGVPRRVRDLARAGSFQPLTSREMLGELERVLVGRFQIPERKVAQVLVSVASWSEVVEPLAGIEVGVRDPGDLRVIACAIAGEADLIITGDRDLLELERVSSVRIVTPRQFLLEYGEDADA